jgi:hypothetical protein
LYGAVLILLGVGVILVGVPVAIGSLADIDGPVPTGPRMLLMYLPAPLAGAAIALLGAHVADRPCRR